MCKFVYKYIIWHHVWYLSWNLPISKRKKHVHSVFLCDTHPISIFDVWIYILERFRVLASYCCVYSAFLSCSVHSLKPMDSFGTWRKWKLNFLGVNAELYRVVWTINALLTVRSEMLQFLGNNQNIKMFGVPIVYVHNDNLPLDNIALQYVIPKNSRKIW